MATYEYRIVELNRSIGDETLADHAINSLAKKGWRVVAGGGAGGSGGPDYWVERQWVVMEREVE